MDPPADPGKPQRRRVTVTGASNGDQREGDAILHKDGTSSCLGGAVVAVARPAVGAAGRARGWRR